MRDRHQRVVEERGDGGDVAWTPTPRAGNHRKTIAAVLVVTRVHSISVRAIGQVGGGPSLIE